MNQTPKPITFLGRFKRWPVWRWVVVGAILLIAFVVWRHHGAGKDTQGSTFSARRGPLDVTVLEGGSVKSVDSQEIKCEVRVGYQGIKILKMVEEGYEVTEDDIKTNKVLVELDSSELQKQITQEDIQYEQAIASLTDAQQNYEIQLNQNMSDIKAAEQKVRFARMDFDKFLGDNVTQVVIDKLGLERELAMEQTNASALASAVTSSLPKAPEGAGSNGARVAAQGSPAGAETAVPSAAAVAPPTAKSAPASASDDLKPTVLITEGNVRAGTPVLPLSGAAAAPKKEATNAAVTPASEPAPLPIPAAVIIDFSGYANIDKLGDGEAKQKLRKFEDDLQVAKKEEGQSKITLEGTQRLFDKGFVTRTDLERDEIAQENSRLKVQTADTARDLFLKYEFPKTGEENLSKYGEAVRELVRAKKAAISKLAQAEAKLKSAQGQYNIQTRQRKELYEQLDKCNITGKKPGLVVYGGAREDMFYYGGEERIREGATVRERQAIITIPDMSKMSVRVKIHESYIKKIKKGQKARITVDAFADKVLDGEVTQVGVLPDSQNMWMNPDMKVYLTTITIDGTQEWLKPGMSAKVEIMVKHLPDVLYVPVQAVGPWNGKQVCYLAGRSAERRVVEVGEYNDEFIEVKNGLIAGDRVLLRTMETAPPEKTDEKKPETAPKAAPNVTAAPAGKGKA